MATRQTFHTPSFGDEEFEILSAPSSYDHHQQQQQLNVNLPSTIGTATGSVNELSSLSHPSSSSLLSSSSTSLYNSNTTTLPTVLANQASSNQWHTTHSVGGNIPVIDNFIGNTGTTTVIMGDHHQNTSVLMPIDDDDTSRYSTDDGTIPATSSVTAAAISKMKRKRDPNEPPKPVSAYALFFRDTQAAIKGQNPDASFGEISKIVASMWDALDPEHKNVYKKKSELAKKEYLKSLAAYRASVISKGEEIINSNNLDNGFQQQQQQNQNGLMISSIQQTYTSAPIIKTIETSNMQQISTIPPSSLNTSVVNVVTLPRPIQHSPSQNLTQQYVTNQPTTITTPMNNVVSHQITNNNQNPHQQQQQQLQNLQPTSIAAQPNLINTTTSTNQQQQSQQQMNLGTESAEQQNQKCIREGCNNTAIVNSDWEDEYCSNECVIIHCRDVFSQWIQANKTADVVQQ